MREVDTVHKRIIQGRNGRPGRIVGIFKVIDTFTEKDHSIPVMRVEAIITVVSQNKYIALWYNL